MKWHERKESIIKNNQRGQMASQRKKIQETNCTVIALEKKYKEYNEFKKTRLQS